MHFTRTIRVESWRVEISVHEHEHNHEVSRAYYFASKELAILAVEWAYAVHVEKLLGRPDVHEIEELPDLSDGSWKLKEIPGKKVTWWKEGRKGFACMKDYFTAQPDEFERTVIGEAASTTCFNSDRV